MTILTCLSKPGIRAARTFGSPWISLLLLVITAWYFGMGATTARGQDNPLANIGIPPFSMLLPIENGYINPATGDVHLEIPIGSYPQRVRPAVSYKYVYDSNIWNQSVCCSIAAFNLPNKPGWNFRSSADTWAPNYVWTEPYICSIDGLPRADVYNNFTWTDSGGNVHTFYNIQSVIGYTTRCGAPLPPNAPNGDSIADDGSGFHMYVQAGPSVNVYSPDGTLVYSDYNGGYPASDTNGNNFSVDIHGNRIDTLGRTPVTSTTVGSVVTLSALNSTGSTSTYTITWAPVYVHTNFGGIYTDVSGSFNAIQSIALPDGTSYSFIYDTGTTAGHFGQVISMTLPTGATITNNYVNYVTSVYQPQGMTREIQQRVTPDGTWTYSPAVIHHCTFGDTSPCLQSFTVTKPSSDNMFYKLNGTLPIELDEYSGAISSPNLLATFTQCFNSDPSCSNAVPYISKSADTVTLVTPSGSVSKTTHYTWDNNGSTRYGNLTKKEEWNFGSSTSGAADRTTAIAYLSGSNYISTTTPIRNILNRPSSITVTNNSGATVSQTLNSYDGSALVTTGATGVSHHDDTNFSSSFAYRGNLTQVQRVVTGTTYLTKSMTYDITGQMRTETDWTNNSSTATQYSYADNFYTDPGDYSNPSSYTASTPTNAYLKTITQGTLVTTSGYYWGTGQTAKTTDPNSQTTYQHYYNPLNQPTSAQLPDSGWMLSSPTVSGGHETGLETYTGIAGSQSTGCSSCRHEKTVVDSLGRASNQSLLNDPACGSGSQVATTYDNNGRVHSVSNPNCSTADYTYGTVVFSAYDGLDRSIQVTKQDGSNSYAYYGAKVSTPGGRSSQLCSGTGYPILTKDEAGKLRQTWTDGFGRLIEADEPDPATGSLTSGSYAGTCYGYDLNDNLTAVTQGTETRTFNYDLLSRLTSAANPENGTTCFYYTTSGGTCGVPASGSLCSGDPSDVCRRVAPSPNQTSSAVTVTTTYSYDALNRMTLKTYSDSYSSNPVMPAAKFFYDQTSPWGFPVYNTIGRLSMEYTAQGATVIASSVFSYDTMGRVTIRGQCSPPTCGVSGCMAQNGLYNYLGEPTYYTDPSGGFSITQSYDNVGHLSQVSSSLSDSQHPATLATVNSYYAPGEIHKITLGNGAMESFVYENRLQPCRMTLYASGTPTSACTNAPPSGNLEDFGFAYGTYGSSDSGNITYWEGSGSQVFARTYTYDYLNRLSSLSDPTTTHPCPGLTWSYDRWANRTGQTVTSGSCGMWSAGYNSKNQATNTGFAYDAAGNFTNDGVNHYMYDAENRLIQINGTIGTCSSATSCNTYDALGNRSEQIVGGTPTEYIFGLDGKVLGDVNGTTLAGQNAYIYLNGNVIAQYTAGWSTTPPTGSTNFAFRDHLGSARVTTSVSGSVVDSMDYAPYGELIAGSGSTTTHKFTGYIRDSNIDFADARHYAWTMGRFMTPDPAGNAVADPGNPQSWNMYSYVQNNPLNLVDPNGYDCVYLNDQGTGIDSVDHLSSQRECWSENGGGGYWANGYVADSNSSIVTNQNNDNIGIFSSEGYSIASQDTTWNPGSMGVAFTPWLSSGSGNGGQTQTSTAQIPTISANHNYEGSKKQLCDNKSNKAMLVDVLPFGSTLLGGDYSPGEVGTSVAKEAFDYGRDAARASPIALKAWRSLTGLPMTMTSKVLSGLGVALTVYNAYHAAETGKNVYQACIGD